MVYEKLIPSHLLLFTSTKHFRPGNNFLMTAHKVDTFIKVAAFKM